MNKSNNVKILEVSLYEEVIGYLTHYQDGTNLFHFHESYLEKNEQNRPILSLSFSNKDLSVPFISRMKLPTFFSNLLPEGALRQLICEQLKIHLDDEFILLEALGDDLPGAITVKRIYDMSEVSFNKKKNMRIDREEEGDDYLHFSLAGVQMKFSMRQQDGRYTISRPGLIGDYIIKTPSTIHAFVPLNEFSCMKLAEAVGIEIPEVKLVSLSDLDGLPKINLPHEDKAYLIKRFDRADGQRIHIEDFAQVFSVRSHRKYNATNYDSIARLIHNLLPNGLAEVQKFIRRIIFNILIGNTDAHLQNWSVIYKNKITPSLSPAYDLVSTLSYIDNRELALNFAKKKELYQINENNLKYFAERLGLSEKVVMDVALDTVEQANQKWRDLMNDLPFTKEMKAAFKTHWRLLKEPMKISINL